MRNPRSQSQSELDAAASRICRAIAINFMLTAVLSAGAFAQSGIAATGTGLPGKGQSPAPAHNGIVIKEPTGSALSSFSDTKTITLTMLAGTQSGTIKVVLNGKDVSDRFSPTSCENAVCSTGTLSESDGLLTGKNVLYAVAKSEGGGVVSSRLRFDGDNSSKTSVGLRSSIHAEDASSSNPALPTLSSFLPPAIALTTSTSTNQSGYKDGVPWITVGSQQKYPNSSLKCSGEAYSVVVLNRATLVEKTAAPESSPQCFADDPSLTKYLKTMTPTDLVIAATNFGIKTDQTHLNLDTSAIGGTNYTGIGQNGYPTYYLAIGVGGAAPGRPMKAF